MNMQTVNEATLWQYRAEKYLFDEDGFLFDPNQWTAELANQIAAVDIGELNELLH